MRHLDWTDELHVGLPTIDDQHKELFTIANDLLEAIERNEGEDFLKKTFDRLRDYTKYHFREEEAYMLEIGYPDLEKHCAEHSVLLLRANTLWRMISNGQEISPKGASLFLSEWISHHIMHSDQKIEEFAKALK